MKPQIIGFIFARGGSKGIPRKNIRLLGGKPLIAHAIETGLASRYIERMIVSTDDEEIAAVARQFGAEVPFVRPSELAQDNSPEWLSWQHAIRTMNAISEQGIDVFVSVPTTAPFRTNADVDNCIETLLNSDADIVFTATPSHRSPYFNMVRLDDDGYAQLVIPPSGTISRRQDAPAVYDMTTAVYAARSPFVLSANGIFMGKSKAVILPAERALDIDTELDFQFAEFLMREKLR